jgi:hypothetical protein
MQNQESTMARTEIDSFIGKFKSLLISGRDATLEIRSNAGKAEVTLHVELGDASHPPAQHQHHPWPRNGPSTSRQRRRIRREAEREAAKAAEPGKDSAEETTSSEMENQAAEANLPTKDSPNENQTLQDEFCSNESFQKISDDELVENILVTADCQADSSDNVVTKLVNNKLKTIGIRMKSITVNRNIKRCFESCIVKIEPMKKKSIEKETFPMNRWTMKCIM